MVDCDWIGQAACGVGHSMVNVNERACDCQSQLVVAKRKVVVGSAMTTWMMGAENDGVRCDGMQKMKGRRGVCRCQCVIVRCDGMQKIKGRRGACRCGPGCGHAQGLASCSANVLVRLLVG
jgi:hypothetical protein